MRGEAHPNEVQPVQHDAGLRALLRRLVMLSSLPAVWLERAATSREPGTEAVAGELADVLVELLKLDFAFVRLRDPVSGRVVDVARGNAPDGLLERLERKPSPGGSEPSGELVVPIGLEGDAGVLAAACERSDFPAPTDRLVLSLAASQVATAFQSARVIDERKRAEEELREARSRLEMNVAARTAELRAANDALAAVRRVATLVAEGIEPQELFAVVAEQVARVVDVPLVSVIRYEPDGTGTECANYSAQGQVFPTGKRWSLEGTNVLALVRDTADAARIDDHSGLEGEIADFVRRTGIHSRVAVPVLVAGRVWGAMVASTTEPEPLPPGTEAHLTEFTELLATAIENAESREALERVGAEQAALRRVATLVARGVEPAMAFFAVSKEVDRLFPSGRSAVVRLEPDGAAHVVVGLAQSLDGVAVGSRFELEDSMASTAVYRTGRPARIDVAGWSAVAGPIAATARRINTVSAVASPIVVAGRLWGVVVTSASEPLPPDAEERLEKFTELAATAIANGDAREELRKLVDEQAALRRVATLVARDAPREEVFTAIAEAIGTLLGSEEIRMLRYDGYDSVVVEAGWGQDPSIFPVGARQPLGGDNVASRVVRTGQPARIDNYARASGTIGETARAVGFHCIVGTPILVDGRLWGLMAAGTMQPDPLPADTDARLGQFTELMATAIANTETRAEIERLAEEQTALRRVATLVARTPASEHLFSTVAREVASVLDVPGVIVTRYDADGTALTLGEAFRPDLAGAERFLGVGIRMPPDPGSLTALVHDTHGPARIDDFSTLPGTLGDLGRGAGLGSGCAGPIMVNGALWGKMCVFSRAGTVLPAGTENRLHDFVELVATAIANFEARADLAASEARARELAEEQAALRRVATLVADDASPTAVFDAAAAELGALLHAHGVLLCRYEPGDELTVVAHLGPEAARLPPGRRVRHDSNSVTAIVRRTQRPARLDSYAETGGIIGELIGRLVFSGGVGAPIVVEGRLWGVAVANWTGDERPPLDTEQRMAEFTELLGIAIANADSRDRLTASRARLLTAADEARRRVVRDLHDGAQQRLVHTIVILKLAQRALRGGGGDAGPLVDKALDHAERSKDELRELAHGIHPPALTIGGLRRAVRALVERLDVPVDVDVLAERLPPELEASAYFFVAEALTNVVKHSRAAHAEVAASVRNGMLLVHVRDDGIGGADPGGHGLVGMKDRVAAQGGRFEITSPAGSGTCVAATLPLAWAALADSP